MLLYLVLNCTRMVWNTLKVISKGCHCISCDIAYLVLISYIGLSCVISPQS